MRKITIAMSSASIPASAARFAKAMGLFEKRGLDATITPMDNGSVATMGLISGSLDFVTTGPSDVVVSQGRGQDIVALNSVYRGFAAVIVLSKAAAEKVRVSPTAPTSDRFKALDGLSIASPSPTSTFTIAVKSSAEAVGAKVNFLYMAQPAMVAALQTGAIQGFVASAPYYVQPVLSGVGVIWINGPKAEFPPQFAPANSAVLITKRDFAVANPDLMQRTTAVFYDFAKAVNERPADVKAAIAKVFPGLDAKTMDLLFETESHGFEIEPLTVEQMAHEIAFMKTGGVNIPRIDSLKPEAMLFP
jgi:ABC-type nitrate/sulfonate/bicarbonate transport system substrate-binding protein